MVWLLSQRIKNCGDGLNEKQADTFQQELVKSWGYEEEEE